MRRFLFENGLSVFFGAIFLGSLLGQSFAGQHTYNAEQLEHGSSGVTWVDYVLSPDFGGKVLENWQSEFLQLGWQVAGLSILWYVGSPQSKESEQRLEKILESILHEVAPDKAAKILRDIGKEYPKD